MIDLSQSRLRLSIRLPRAVRPAFFISYALSSLSILIVLTVLFTLQPVVPMFYTLPTPEQQLVPKEWLLLFPAVSFFISLGHTLLVNHLYRYEAVIGYIFGWVTVVIQVMLLLSMARIIWIVA